MGKAWQNLLWDSNFKRMPRILSLDPKDISVVVTLCTWGIWALCGFSFFFFFKLFFIDTLFPPVFFIAAHMLCSLCTSQQELLLLFLTVWSIFMLLVPCSDLFLILTNIHFQTHLLKRSLYSAKDRVRHGGKEASDPYHPGTAHCQPTWAVFTKDANSQNQGILVLRGGFQAKMDSMHATD